MPQDKLPLGQKAMLCILIFSIIPAMSLAMVSFYSLSVYHNNIGKDISLTISMIERTPRGENPELIYMLDDIGRKSEAISNHYKTIIIIISVGFLTMAILTGLVFIKIANGKRPRNTVPKDMNAALSSDSMLRDLTQLRDNIDLLIQMLKKIK